MISHWKMGFGHQFQHNLSFNKNQSQEKVRVKKFTKRFQAKIEENTKNRDS